ncbi:hypothetical protein N656DRAFT_764638 [Canariomyces notabilis]|uniref:Uncharacterized protein n=1 Tax=Canariomyces notabilis TaxID=2074819 RepID=A0AAN6YXQ6_9PEZI|nr:hypothetical protein N656DRAFT_764638 [Canariomyces arenarius]
MGSLPQDPFDVSRVHILFQRHGQAVSNIVDYETPGITAENITLDELTRLATCDPNLHLRTGVFLPDGLTSFGLDSSYAFVDDVTDDNGVPRLDNVYMLVSSPLTRAHQTLQANSRAFGLVGPFHGGAGAGDGGSTLSETANIYCHPGFREATTWPHDFPPLRLVNPEVAAATAPRDGHITNKSKPNPVSTNTVSYIRVAGGSGRGCGRVVGETHVDTSRLVWAGSNLSRSAHDTHQWQNQSQSQSETLETRMAAVTAEPDLASVERAVREARVWLRGCARRVLFEHVAAGRAGTPRIVVCLHGGIINFVMQSWHCDFRRDSAQQDWRWHRSVALRPLDIVVCRFQQEQRRDEDDAVDGGEARLVELDPNSDEAEDYARVLGRYYRHLSSDGNLVYQNPDGSWVDQKAAHCKFIVSKAHEVRAVAAERREVLERLVMWTSAKEFLASI